MSPSRSRRRKLKKKKKSNKKIIILSLIVIVIILIIGYVFLSNNTKNQNGSSVSNKMKVLLETSKGNIVIKLRDDMPITTTNFKKLVSEGIYDNTIFHRVIADFMIQGGDPNGNGFSDDGIATIQDEFTDQNENNRRTIAMAKSSDQFGQIIPHSGSSQFFINVVDNNNLDDGYSVFGEVIDGMDVVDLISIVETDGNPPQGANRPLEEIRLIKATFID